MFSPFLSVADKAAGLAIGAVGGTIIGATDGAAHGTSEGLSGITVGNFRLRRDALGSTQETPVDHGGEVSLDFSAMWIRYIPCFVVATKDGKAEEVLGQIRAGITNAKLSASSTEWVAYEGAGPRVGGCFHGPDYSYVVLAFPGTKVDEAQLQKVITAACGGEK
nr:MAG: hypothetical protein [Grapevine umbra-like virus 4]